MGLGEEIGAIFREAVRGALPIGLEILRERHLPQPQQQQVLVGPGGPPGQFAGLQLPQAGGGIMTAGLPGALARQIPGLLGGLGAGELLDLFGSSGGGGGSFRGPRLVDAPGMFHQTRAGNIVPHDGIAVGPNGKLVGFKRARVKLVPWTTRRHHHHPRKR